MVGPARQTGARPRSSASRSKPGPGPISFPGAELNYHRRDGEDGKRFGEVLEWAQAPDSGKWAYHHHMRGGSSTEVHSPGIQRNHLSLESLASHAHGCTGVRESDVQPGDWVIIRTKNSTYCLRANGDGTFDASGGWFSRHERAGQGLRIAGCTWGGSAILTGMVAVPGMCLEFANRVTTTRIRGVRHIRSVASPTTH